MNTWKTLKRKRVNRSVRILYKSEPKAIVPLKRQLLQRCFTLLNFAYFYFSISNFPYFSTSHMRSRMGKSSISEHHFFLNITTVIDNIITKKGINYLISHRKVLLITVTTYVPEFHNTIAIYDLNSVWRLAEDRGRWQQLVEMAVLQSAAFLQ